MLALTAVWNSSRRTIVSSLSTTLSTLSKVGESCHKCPLHLDLYQVLCIRSLSSGCRSLRGRQWHSSRRISPTRFELFIKDVWCLVNIVIFKDSLRQVFAKSHTGGQRIDCVIHFAALKVELSIFVKSLNRCSPRQLESLVPSRWSTTATMWLAAPTWWRWWTSCFGFHFFTIYFSIFGAFILVYFIT